MHWIDCWCPDAARFVLVEGSTDLSTANCHRLLDAIDDSHLCQRIRLVCKASTFADDALLDMLRGRNLGLLLEHDGEVDLERFTEQGILGVRLGAVTLRGSEQRSQTIRRARRVVRAAHDLGLRSIASQIPSSVDVRDFLAIGIDYVSQRNLGFVPAIGAGPNSSYVPRLVGSMEGASRRGANEVERPAESTARFDPGNP